MGEYRGRARHFSFFSARPATGKSSPTTLWFEQTRNPSTVALVTVPIAWFFFAQPRIGLLFLPAWFALATAHWLAVTLPKGKLEHFQNFCSRFPTCNPWILRCAQDDSFQNITHESVILSEAKNPATRAQSGYSLILSALETSRAFQVGFRAEVDGKPVEVAKFPEGFVMIPVPAGPADIQLTYHAPRLLLESYWISLIAIGGGARRALRGH